MHEIISSKKAEIEEICRRYNVQKLEVFGSAARGVDFNPETSDADFLVQFKRFKNRSGFHSMRFTKDMEQVLGRKVDVISNKVADIRNPYLRESIDGEQELVYEAEPLEELSHEP